MVLIGCVWFVEQAKGTKVARGEGSDQLLLLMSLRAYGE